MALLARVVLIVMVTAAPWLFGGVQARLQVWLLAGTAVALACWLIGCLRDRPARTVVPLAVVPLVCGLGLGIFQLVPLDAPTRAFFSPRGAELTDALSSTPSPQQPAAAEQVGIAAAPARQPLSLYPASTRRDLALLVLGLSTFLLGAAFFRTPGSGIWLCAVIAVNGAALAFWGLVQGLTWNGMLYWCVPLSGGGGPFGPFVNHNNAGSFLGLCLAGALGMAIWAAGRTGSDHRETGPSQQQPFSQFPLGTRRRFVQTVAGLNAPTLAALCLIALILAGIVCSLSRGTWLATIGATLVTLAVVYHLRRRTLRLWWLGFAATAAAALVLWVGMSGAAHARFATLLDREAISQARIPHWRDGLDAVPDFWRSGSGLGTYRYLYGQYQQRLDQAWYYYAENQYIEALVEAGVPGLGLTLAAIALVGHAAWRLLRDDTDPGAVALGIAGVFAISGQAIHACFDFALHIPANAMLLALLCGSLSGRAAGLPRRRAAPAPTPTPAPLATSRSLQFAPAVLVAVLLAAAVWATSETRRVAAMEATFNDTPVPQTLDEAAPEDLHHAIERLAPLLDQRSDDAAAQYRMAELWIQLYRIGTFERLREDEPLAIDDAALWQSTTPGALHYCAHELSRRGLRSELERLRGEPATRDCLQQAFRHLLLARRGCPLLPEVHLTLAALGVLAGDPTDERIHLDRVRRLAPADPDLHYQCGVFEKDAGRWDSAYESWRKSLTLSTRHIDEILRLVDWRIIHPETIEKLLPDSPTLLIQLARERYAGAENTQLRRQLAQRAEDLIGRADLPEDQRHYLQGSVFALRGLYPQAAASYSRAVALRVEEPRWRYELALALRQQGMLADAREQARLCVRMEPGQHDYRALLEEINHTRLATDAAARE